MQNIQVTTSYRMVDGRAVKVERREYDPTKPGLAALLKNRYPVPASDEDWQAQRATIENQINQLRQLDVQADWHDNSLICRGVTVQFVIDALRDLIRDKQDAMTHKVVVTED